MMFASLLAHALGELTAYAIGPGQAASNLSSYELDRDLYTGA